MIDTGRYKFKNLVRVENKGDKQKMKSRWCIMENWWCYLGAEHVFAMFGESWHFSEKCSIYLLVDNKKFKNFIEVVFQHNLKFSGKISENWFSENFAFKRIVMQDFVVLQRVWKKQNRLENGNFSKNLFQSTNKGDCSSQDNDF